MNSEEFAKAYETGRVEDYYTDKGEYIVVVTVIIPEMFKTVSTPIGNMTRKVRGKTIAKIHFDNYSDFVEKIKEPLI